MIISQLTFDIPCETDFQVCLVSERSFDDPRLVQLHLFKVKLANLIEIHSLKIGHAVLAFLKYLLAFKSFR